MRRARPTRANPTVRMLKSGPNRAGAAKLRSQRTYRPRKRSNGCDNRLTTLANLPTRVRIPTHMPRRITLVDGDRLMTGGAHPAPLGQYDYAIGAARIFAPRSMGRCRRHPFTKVELSAAPARETVTPREHVDIFCETAVRIGRRSMAVWARLSCKLCQRAGDARLLSWTRYNGGRFRLSKASAARSFGRRCCHERTGTPIRYTIRRRHLTRSGTLPIFPSNIKRGTSVGPARTDRRCRSNR
jgi:hypothetical protein